MSYLTKLMLLAGALVIGLIAGTAIGDTDLPGKFWQWRDAQGVAYTDTESRIPKTYKERAIRRDFEKMLEKRTEMILSDMDQRGLLQARLEKLRTEAPAPVVEVCGPPFTVTKERRDHKVNGQSLNSLFYVIMDSCGKEVAATTQRIDLYLELY